eukprot:TRINITY_DN1722_c0_g1_i1.p1 TRINITY_DN1722_c0_g1~~TRINITY_DN1722_c0_g1_i1.p1  ORF type:complete len:950 (+),score=149.32 TRINITY_DN1722_c0_g1_i1:132-2981(+)
MSDETESSSSGSEVADTSQPAGEGQRLDAASDSFRHPRTDEDVRRYTRRARSCGATPVQFCALLIKTFNLQKRNYCTNICQCLTPLILLILILLLNLWASSLIADSLPADRNPAVLPPYTVLSNPRSQFVPPVRILYTNNGSADPEGIGLFSLMPNTTTTYFIDYPDSLLFPDPLQITRPNTNISLAYEQQASREVIDNFLYDKFGERPDYAAAYEFITLDTADNNYVFNVFYNYSLTRGRDIASSASFVTDALSSLINGAVFGYVYAGVQAIPNKGDDREFDLASLVGPLLYSLILHQLLPVFLGAIVYEKEHRLREMMKMMGMKMWLYWFIVYLWNYFLYFVLMCILIFGGIILRFKFFTVNATATYFFLFAIWGHTLIALTFFLSVFFTNTRTAIVFSYFYIIAQAFVGQYLVADIVSNPDSSNGDLFGISVEPSMALFRGLTYLGNEVSYNGPGIHGSDVTNRQANMVAVYEFLIVQWIVLLAVASYLDNVVPAGYGVKKHPLFFLGWLKRVPPISLYYKRKARILNEKAEVYSRQISVGEPEDVAAARARAHTDDMFALRIKEVVKQYGSRWEGWLKVLWWAVVYVMTCGRKGKGSRPDHRPKRAVDSVAFTIEPGECLGILGPNGAGKTSLISILVGLYEPTSGAADIFGLDTQSQTEECHTITGVCPQHDILWENMTASEHLYFYARLKGVPMRAMKSQVRKALKSVSLYKVRNKYAGKYSGGMKRRLSVAISLIANPLIVFLDEPTTGLDPRSKRGLWRVMMEKKKESALLLTTHSMEEAEALCDRLVIMSRGRVRAVGTAVELKSRFGAFYKLSMLCKPDTVEDAHQFVMQALPQARLLHSIAGSREYSVPKNSTRLSEIFQELEAHKEELGIKDWGVSNTTLEEVFHIVVNGETNTEVPDPEDSSDDEDDDHNNNNIKDGSSLSTSSSSSESDVEMQAV